MTWLDPEPTFRGWFGACGACHRVRLAAWWWDSSGVHKRMSTDFYDGGEIYEAWREGQTLRWTREACEGAVHLLDGGLIERVGACTGRWPDE